jgi:hypothetical protein
MFPGSINLSLAHIPGGIYAATGARIIPVHHSHPGNLTDAPSWWGDEGCTTVQIALSRCRSGRGDIIQMLPGHLETLAVADSWSNLAATGVTVRAPDYGPPATIRWTAAGATLLMDQADFVIDGGPNRNLRLEMAGDLGSTTALTVAAPITGSAARCKIVRTWGSLAVDANQLVTDAVTLGAGADYFQLAGNMWIGQAGGVITSAVTVSAAGCDYLSITDNHLEAEIATAATGVLLDLDAGAILHNQILRNVLWNKTALSVYVIDGHASSTGLIDYNLFIADTSGTAPGSAAIAGCDAMYFGHENFCVTAPVKSAIICPPVDA